MIVFFGYDFTPTETPKVFLRCLLYSTAARGIVVEGMYANVRHAGTERLFGFWGHGETNKLVPGSGLFVGQSGLAANHHFVLSVHERSYVFTPGQYTIDVFAREVGKAKPTRLESVSVTLTEDQTAALADRSGVLFELEAESQRYVGHVNNPSRLPPQGSTDSP